MKQVKNLSASVAQRLKNEAKRTNRPYNDLLLLYAIERFLYRLGKSGYCKRFVLKGGLALLTFDAVFPRATRDIDLLGFTENSIENLESIVRQVCQTPVADDGVTFDLETIKGTVIKEDAEYSGVRLKFDAFLGNSKSRVQIDVGFGDRVNPDPECLDYPTILADSPKPCIQIYLVETVIAEKVEAVISLDLLNSRLKDYFDIWFLSETMSIDGAVLSQALRETFEQRKTKLHMLPDAFFEEFNTAQNRRQWEAMKNKSLDPGVFPELSDALQRFRVFISPVVDAASAGQKFMKTWHPDRRDWL
jgi:hypothetical protein